MKKLIVKLYEETDEFGERCGQEIICDGHDEIRFSCSNLSECPEDAIIGRALFDALDYVNVLRYGIELGKQGYDSIEIERLSPNE